MRPTTLLLFQLLLSIFAIYAMLENIINYHIIVPLFCMVAMFFVGRCEGEKRQKISEPAHEQGTELAAAQERRDHFRRWSNSLSHRIWVVKPLAILTCFTQCQNIPDCTGSCMDLYLQCPHPIFFNRDSRSCQSQEKIQKLTKNHKILEAGSEITPPYQSEYPYLVFLG